MLIFSALQNLKGDYRPAAAGEAPAAEVVHTQHSADSCWGWEVSRLQHHQSSLGNLVESYDFDAVRHTDWHNVKEPWQFQRVFTMIATSTDLFIMVRRCLLTFKPFR